MCLRIILFITTLIYYNNIHLVLINIFNYNSSTEVLKTRSIIFNRTHVIECCYSIVLYSKTNQNLYT